MDISRHIEEFARKNHRYKPYSKICRKMLLGGMPYSLNSQKGYETKYGAPKDASKSGICSENSLQGGEVGISAL